MRFAENISDNIHSDFLPRRYLAPFKKIAPLYALSVVLIIGSLQFQQTLGLLASSLVAFALISAMSAYVYVQLQQSNDLAMATDFQNLLFAGAASLGSSFCFFVRLDGHVVYANDGTRQMFPHFAQSQSNALEAILHEAAVISHDANRLLSAIAKGKKESLIATIQDAKGQRNAFIISVQPLPRPSGYFVVQGRPFSAQRQGVQKLPDALGNTSIDKIETLLDTLPLGIYLTSNTGIIEYANPALEAMLGYEPRSFMAKSDTLQATIFHADGFETGAFEMVDFSGNVLLARRNQSLAQAFLDQRRMPHADGSLRGVLGIVTPQGS